MNYQLNIPIVVRKRKKFSIVLMILMVLAPSISFWQSEAGNKNIVLIFLVLWGIVFFTFLLRRMVIKEYVEIGDIRIDNDRIEIVVDNKITVFRNNDIIYVFFRFGSTSQDSAGRSFVPSEGINNYIYFNLNDIGLIQYRIFIKNKSTANYLQTYLKNIYAEKYKFSNI